MKRRKDEGEDKGNSMWKGPVAGQRGWSCEGTEEARVAGRRAGVEEDILDEVEPSRCFK